MNKLSLLILSAMTALTPAAHAGFADTMRELRGTLNQITETTKELSGTAKEVSGFGSGANSSNANASYTAGQRLYPKINNLALYQSPNKSSPVVSKLSKNTDVVFAGNMNKNGLIEVSTEYGNGWIESHLVQ
ncbi:hypothetical protein [Acinetobacter tianfuensis]|nr:hypothetical protein [Acinetobacter tianfuensis]